MVVWEFIYIFVIGIDNDCELIKIKPKTTTTMNSDYHSRHEGEDYGEQICSKVVKAGKRTYFIDVKATRGDDYYLTITESRKRIDKDGYATFSRNQIYLYKEDFKKFAEGLDQMVEFVKCHKPEYFAADESLATTSIDEEFDNL